MDLKVIRELLQIVAHSDVAEVEVEHDGLKVIVRRSAPSVTVQPAGFPPYWPPYGPLAAPPSSPPPLPVPEPNGPASPPSSVAAETAVNPNNELIIRAPIVGTFYRASSPDSPAFVEIGDVVNPGDTLCIIEAMKLMNEIESEVGGTIKQILVQNAEPVEYDQPLFLVERS
jgi:acetyl-CoA carboxylase biotin carboxyl carrier protein